MKSDVWKKILRGAGLAVTIAALGVSTYAIYGKVLHNTYGTPYVAFWSKDSDSDQKQEVAGGIPDSEFTITPKNDNRPTEVPGSVKPEDEGQKPEGLTEDNSQSPDTSENAPDSKDNSSSGTAGSTQFVATDHTYGLSADYSMETIANVDGQIPSGYYNNMLFIGDSRVQALMEYGNAEGMAYFCKEGMNIYDLDDERLDCDGMTGVTLEEVLAAKQYKRIYLMIGLNELGYNLNNNLNKDLEWVDKIMEAQPDAQLVLCSILHVSSQHAIDYEYENNVNIDYINSGLRMIAEDRGILYLDENPLFDNASGDLDTTYSSDGCHPYASYVKKWVIWLATGVTYP